MDSDRIVNSRPNAAAAPKTSFFLAAYKPLMKTIFSGGTPDEEPVFEPEPADEDGLEKIEEPYDPDAEEEPEDNAND
jgi:hypothetical protein